MDIGAWFQIEDQPDGGYLSTSYELVFYRDLNTGLVMQDWTNPYTGERVPITNRSIGPTVNRYGADGRLVLPTELGGAKVEATNRVGLLRAEGEDVWISDDYTASVTPPGGDKPFVVNDWSSYLGRRAEIDDPAVTTAAATNYLQEVTGWQRWMKMGDRTGTLYARAVGRKVSSFDDMPVRYRQAVAETYPDIARDPVGAFARAPESFAR